MTNKLWSGLPNQGAAVRYFALITGILFLLLGIAGFVPGLVSLPAAAPNVTVDAPRLAVDSGYGYVLGLFPTNVVHNIVHILVGVLGIAAYTSVGSALTFTRGYAIAYALIAVMGLFSFSNTTLGVMPIYGNNVWLNGISAALAAYLGFAKPTEPNISSTSIPNVEKSSSGSSSV